MMSTAHLELVGESLDTRKQPWVCSPYSLISWWDMEQFSAAGFFGIATQLTMLVENAESDGRTSIQISLTPEQRATFLRALAQIEADCAKLGCIHI